MELKYVISATLDRPQTTTQGAAGARPGRTAQAPSIEVSRQPPRSDQENAGRQDRRALVKLANLVRGSHTAAETDLNRQQTTMATLTPAVVLDLYSPAYMCFL